MTLNNLLRSSVGGWATREAGSYHACPILPGRSWTKSGPLERPIPLTCLPAFLADPAEYLPNCPQPLTSLPKILTRIDSTHDQLRHHLNGHGHTQPTILDPHPDPWPCQAGPMRPSADSKAHKLLRILAPSLAFFFPHKKKTRDLYNTAIHSPYR